jgi:hypothetical protein
MAVLPKHDLTFQVVLFVSLICILKWDSWNLIFGLRALIATAGRLSLKQDQSPKIKVQSPGVKCKRNVPVIFWWSIPTSCF